MSEVTSVEGGLEVAAQYGYPCIIRPHYALRKPGWAENAAIANNPEEMRVGVEQMLALSPIQTVTVGPV